MSFSIETQQKRLVSVLTLSGRLTLGEATNKLRSTVEQELGNGHKNIILNMSGVSYVDSAGLGALVFLHTQAARHDGKVKLVGLTGSVVNLLQVTKLSTVFDTFENEAVAVMSFE